MKINPIMTTPPTRISNRVAAQSEPKATALEENESAVESEVVERSRPGPQRDSAPLTSWRKNYEAELGLEPKLTKLRKQALEDGGPEMLYRMYPLLFQQDLQGPYQAMAQLLPEKGPKIALAGACHLGNFGTLRNANQEVLWSLNDYDQVGKGRVESDLCRAAASLTLLCKTRGWDKKTAQKLVEEFTDRYCQGIEARPQEAVLGLDKESAREPVHALIKKAEKRTQEDLLAKWAQPEGDGFKFKLGDDLHPLEPEQSDRLQRLLDEVRLPSTVNVLDQCCRWDAGGSSMGLERYYILVQKDGESLPVIVELKQVLPCALGTSDPDPKNCDAELLRKGFKWMGAPKDHWQRVIQGDNGVYLMRERQRARDSLKSEDIREEDADKLARQIGKVLAQAHCNGGKADKISDWIDGQKKLLSDNLYDFAHSYSLQMTQDFQELFRS
ncbi:DUF2252 family protein [bacterium]|nr:DUF2252 family protein [bacterium]